MNKSVEQLLAEKPVRISALPRWKDGNTAPSFGFAFLCVFCAALSLIIVFWPFFGSHFDHTESDPGDGRLELTILEHWTKVFHHQAPLASPNFFYPEKGVLGYTDTFLGLALPHAMFRSFGADPYLAVQLATMFSVALGFVAMYLLMRSILRFARSTALIGATLFVVSNMYYIYVVHPYILASVITAPILFLLFGKYWQEKDVKATKAAAYLCAAAILLALAFYTSYYITWFVSLCAASVAAFYVACRAFVVRSESPVSQAFKVVWQQKWTILLAVAVFVVSMLPFLALYLPVLHRTGKRTLAETIVFMPRAVGIFDVGRDNLIWGKVSARIESFVIPGSYPEHPTGWPLFTILVFLATAFYCGVRLLRSRRDRSHRHAQMLCLISAIAITCLTLWTACIRIGSHAPVWWFLTKFVPGAAAIRVPQRIDLVLNIGVVIVCMFGFEALRKKLAVYGSPAFLVLLLLAGGLVIEQLNAMPTHLLSRATEADNFAHIPPPPKNCSTFYVSDWSDNGSGMLQIQTAAMMIAQRYNIPTLGGYSSWFPVGWSLIGAPRGKVSDMAIEWAKENNVSNGLCALNMTWGVWKPATEAKADEATSSIIELVPGQAQDSGFEGGDLSFWTPFLGGRATLATQIAHSGNHSMAETDGEGSAYQDVFGLQPGQRYRVSAWVSASAGATAGARIALFDPGANTVAYSPTVHPDQNWQLLSQNLTVSQKGTFRIHLFRTQGTGSIYWDDVNVQPDSGAEKASK